MMSEKKLQKVLLLGSGALSIGQAGEFDYSGSQAIAALLNEGIEVVVVNPNIATVQTNPQEGVKVYLYPVTPFHVERIIAKEKPNGIIGGFGGQTALNCLIDLEKTGVLANYGVKNLGTSVSTLELSEDRDLFAKKMKQLSLPISESKSCHTVEEAIKASLDIGYPVLMRACFALGGEGSGFAHNDQEAREIAEKAFAVSEQVLVEKSLKGFKELEYEIMRDQFGNMIAICNMENIDPLGIHTGDSIVVAPSQSLTDIEYHTLRDAAFKIVDAMGVIGECNVQFALSPYGHEFYVIEMNARLSRSSALASKATGYPIAFVAAQVVLGKSLLEIKNPVTGVTCALFEPALDYVVIKIPRWDMGKFEGVDRTLGSSMKSVGEIMAIGRTFPEALQKAVRMVTESELGLSLYHQHVSNDSDEIESSLKSPTDLRLFVIFKAISIGYSTVHLNTLTYVDMWFIDQFQEIVRIETNLSRFIEKAIDSVHLLEIKQYGFSDAQIAFYTKQNEEDVRALRLRYGIVPYVKKVDTTAGEYPAQSNYLYMTYHGFCHDEWMPIPQRKILILGAGAYRIGTSVEFDWCAVSASQWLKSKKICSVMINCNPETVSTDFNMSDLLFFEELSLERIRDIGSFIGCQEVIACMGGQIPNRLAKHLVKSGFQILGHSSETIDLAEDRKKFSAILDELCIDQPRWMDGRIESDQRELQHFIAQIGFPLLVRPSYVLSGAAMGVAYDQNSLAAYLTEAKKAACDQAVVVSEFISGAREIECDGVASCGELLCSFVSEHIENAGIHSGDATTVMPAQMLYVETVRQVKKATASIARALNLHGPFNMQFLAKDNHIKVIECNARAARSFPFISKVTGVNLAELATRVLLGERVPKPMIAEDELPHVGVKAAMFSFRKLSGFDPILSVEMRATGEVGCIASTFEEALILALGATQIPMPKKGVLVSAGTIPEKVKFVHAAHQLDELGLKIYGTNGTADFLNEHGSCRIIAVNREEALELVRRHEVDLVINIPKNVTSSELTFGRKIRKESIGRGIALITSMEKARALIAALRYHAKNSWEEPKALGKFFC